jgi:hypothetical protein
VEENDWRIALHSGGTSCIVRMNFALQEQRSVYDILLLFSATKRSNNVKKTRKRRMNRWEAGAAPDVVKASLEEPGN